MIKNNNLESKFESLYKKWKNETRLHSSISKITNSSYLEIINLGKEVVPMILRKLRKSPDHWFPALKILTGASPVDSKDIGNIKKMTEAWLKWGELNKL